MGRRAENNIGTFDISSRPERRSSNGEEFVLLKRLKPYYQLCLKCVIICNMSA